MNANAIECVRAFSLTARARDRRDREPGAHVREERVPGARGTVLHSDAHDRRVGARILSQESGAAPVHRVLCPHATPY